jgi:hypothetical protein
MVIFPSPPHNDDVFIFSGADGLFRVSSKNFTEIGVDRKPIYEASQHISTSRSAGFNAEAFWQGENLLT